MTDPVTRKPEKCALSTLAEPRPSRGHAAPTLLGRAQARVRICQLVVIGRAPHVRLPMSAHGEVFAREPLILLLQHAQRGDELARLHQADGLVRSEGVGVGAHRAALPRARAAALLRAALHAVRFHGAPWQLQRARRASKRHAWAGRRQVGAPVTVPTCPGAPRPVQLAARRQVVHEGTCQPVAGGTILYDICTAHGACWLHSGGVAEAPTAEDMPATHQMG